MPSPTSQGEALQSPRIYQEGLAALQQEPHLLLLFLRLLLLFLPRAAEHSERTDELWMLALSKSDSSRSSSSLCRGREEASEPGIPTPGAHPRTLLAWMGQVGRCRARGGFGDSFLGFTSPPHPDRSLCPLAQPDVPHPPSPTLQSPGTSSFPPPYHSPGSALHPAKLPARGRPEEPPPKTSP